MESDDFCSCEKQECLLQLRYQRGTWRTQSSLYKVVRTASVPTRRCFCSLQDPCLSPSVTSLCLFPDSGHSQIDDSCWKYSWSTYSKKSRITLHTYRIHTCSKYQIQYSTYGTVSIIIIIIIHCLGQQLNNSWVLLDVSRAWMHKQKITMQKNMKGIDNWTTMAPKKSAGSDHLHVAQRRKSL